MAPKQTKSRTPASAVRKKSEHKTKVTHAAHRARRGPKSHYKKLSEEKKSEIRPFRFLELYGELRNQIYEYTLICQSDKVTNKSPKGRLLMQCVNKYSKPPSLQLLSTCRELRDEGRDFFYKENTFEIVFDMTEIDLVHGGVIQGGVMNTFLDLTHPLTDWMIDTLHLPSIRHLHVAVVLGDMNCRIGIDWNILTQMTNLQKLDVAILFESCQNRPHPYNLVEEREHWKRAMFLEMMVIRILEFVPEHVELEWKIWDTLAFDLKVNWRVWRNEIDIERVRAIAKEYAMHRGRKVLKDVVVSEGQCCAAGS